MDFRSEEDLDTPSSGARKRTLIEVFQTVCLSFNCVVSMFHLRVYFLCAVCVIKGSTSEITFKTDVTILTSTAGKHEGHEEGGASFRWSMPSVTLSHRLAGRSSRVCCGSTLTVTSSEFSSSGLGSGMHLGRRLRPRKSANLQRHHSFVRLSAFRI